MVSGMENVLKIESFLALLETFPREGALRFHLKLGYAFLGSVKEIQMGLVTLSRGFIGCHLLGDRPY